MKKIGFLSFGHWSDHPSYQTRTAGDTLLQSIDLAVAAEEIGIDGAYFRVHHFARQLASPFPLLSAIGAKTNKIEIGTGVIDMRYENPLYMVEDAGAADLIFLARELLKDPYFPLHAANALKYDVKWPVQYERAKRNTFAAKKSNS